VCRASAIIYSANIKLRNSGAGSVHVIEVAKQLNLQGRLLRLLVPTYEGAFSCETLSGGKMRVLQLFRNSNLSLVFFDVIIIPYLIYYRVIYGRYNLLCRPHVFTLFQNMIANFIGCKVIYEVNGVEELEYKAKGLPSWLCAYFKLSIRWNATFVHKFQCVTKGIAEYLRKVYKIPSTKLLVIENGVDLDLFFPMDKSRSREKFRLPQERFIAGFIGSFAPWQGLVNTVKAIAQIDVSLPVTGVFVGGGMLRGELLKIALHAPDNRFIFIDWIPHKNVPDIISAFDLALLIR
jgi:glycosyltransferase involved in cell wall biosynthesis